MDRKMPNKRKSLTKNATPTKIRKTNTPVSQKNKSPKAANKIIQKQGNGNTFSKSPNKMQKTPQKKQTNEKQNTPNKGKKPKEVLEEEESEENEISDDSMEEIDGNNENSDALDSDNEVVEIEENAESDEAEIDGSNEEAEVAEEADSDDEAEVVEKAASDDEDDEEHVETEEENDSEGNNDIEDKSENNDKNPKNKTQFIAYVKSVTGNLRVRDIFKDCNVVSFTLLRNKYTNTAHVKFADKISFDKALSKNGTKVNDNYVTVEKPGRKNKKFIAYVYGLQKHMKIENIFVDSKIIFSNFGGSNNIRGSTYIEFADEESLEKALLRDGTQYNNSIISVSLPNYRVFVKGLKPYSNIENIFNDCNIQSYKLLNKKLTIEFTGNAIVNFKDKESRKKALAKNNTEIDGQTILVEHIRSKAKTEYDNKFRTAPRPLKFGSSAKLRDNPNIMKKKILLDELKSKALKLEQEIYGS